MSERLNHSAENKVEKIEASAESQQNLERLEQKALEAKEQKLDIAELQKNVEKQAQSKEAVKIDKTEHAPSQEIGAYGALKSQTYTRTLKRVQSRLSAPEKAMSKVMHNKVVEPVSELAGKTVARPSGILGGGIVALFGSSLLLYLSKHYGFSYNFFVFFILLAGGFVIGILGELTVRAIAKAKRS